MSGLYSRLLKLATSTRNNKQIGLRRFVFLLTLRQALSAAYQLFLGVLSKVGMRDGVNTFIGLKFSGRFRSLIAFAKGEEVPPLFILQAAYTSHNIVPIDCRLFGSHHLKFVNLFR